MTFHVLKNETEIREARQTLVERSLSSLPHPATRLAGRLMARLGLSPSLILGDYVKSWDLLKSVEFLEQHVPRNSPILDIGAYASEILIAMHKAGFTDLTGADLNSKLSRMPFPNKIRYVESDFMATPFKDQSFKAITSISVIEHGYDPERLLREVSRLLVPGGYFLASFDYWPNKIDTGSTRFFDMSWLIFSKDDLEELLSIARGMGLVPAGNMEPDADKRAIEHGGYHYTFGWLVLQKQA